MLSINNADWFIYGVICFSNKSELEISYFLGKRILLFPLAEYTPLKAFAYQAQVGMVRLTLCLSVSASGPRQVSCATWRFSPRFGAYCVLHPLPAALRW